MRIFFFLTVFLNATQLLAQTEFDDIEAIPIPNGKDSFYVGQSISFQYIVRNKSASSKNYDVGLMGIIEKITDEKGKEIFTYDPDYGMIIERIYDKEPLLYYYVDKVTPIPGLYEEKVAWSLNYERYGNISISHILNISGSQMYQSGVQPFFLFSPGRYTAFVKIHLANTPHSLNLTYSFTVFPSEHVPEYSEFMTKLRNVFNENILNNKTGGDIKYQAVKEFMHMLKDDPKGKYALPIIYLLSLEISSTDNIQAFMKSNKNVYELFELLPKIRPFYDPLPGITLMHFYAKRIKEFKVEGLIKDERGYLDNYLKRIKHLDSKISETLIREARHSLKMEGLINYAAAKN